MPTRREVRELNIKNAKKKKSAGEQEKPQQPQRKQFPSLFVQVTKCSPFKPFQTHSDFGHAAAAVKLAAWN